MFKKAYASRRCLIPIDGFFEWKDIFGTGKNKQPYAIAMKSGEPFALAGIWEKWRDPHTGEDIRTFCVVTCPPNEMMATIHDRMPVVLHQEDYERWLSTEPDSFDLMKPFPADLMTMWPITGSSAHRRTTLLTSSTRLNLPNEAPSFAALSGHSRDRPSRRSGHWTCNGHRWRHAGNWQRARPPARGRCSGELADMRRRRRRRPHAAGRLPSNSTGFSPRRARHAASSWRKIGTNGWSECVFALPGARSIAGSQTGNAVNWEKYSKGFYSDAHRHARLRGAGVWRGSFQLPCQARAAWAKREARLDLRSTTNLHCGVFIYFDPSQP